MPETPEKRSIPKGLIKAIVASSIGNVVEWMDWAVYGLAAPFIAAQFFPATDPTTSLLQAYGVFAIGFLIRPLGAMILGPYGDKHGRNKALVLSILLMGGATALLGLVPTYASIGIIAPILVMLLRITQGFSLGGEWGAAESYMYEIAPPNRRALVTSLRPSGTGLGFFIGSAMITLMTMAFSPEALRTWAWRIPFLLAAATALLGLYIRLKVPESPHFLKAKEAKQTSQRPLNDSVKYHKRGMAIVFGLAMISNSVYYVLYTFMPVHLKTSGGMSYGSAMKMTTLAMLFNVILIPCFGWVADKYSKKLLLSISTLGFTICAYPSFRLINTGNYWAILGSFLFFVLLYGIYAGAAQMILAEQFPTGTRNTSMSLAFTLHATLFGGTAPLTVTWLTKVLHDPLAPAYYMTVCSAIGYLAARYASYRTDETMRHNDKALASQAF
ncbi:MAG: MFS transporter [Candidatus Korobacteraceae bacterium]|jgi:MHS family proline/betaine transporter-like MFS transporter